MSGLERSYTAADHCTACTTSLQHDRKERPPRRRSRARIHRPLLTCLPPYGLGVATHRRVLAKTRQK